MARIEYDFHLFRVTDQDSNTKKKNTKTATKPKSQSSTVSKVNKTASKSTFMGGGASVQKVKQTASKPKTPSKPKQTSKPKTLTTKERINQKSYGTTQAPVRRTTSAATKTQRKANAEANMNLKQTQIQKSTEARQERRTQRMATAPQRRANRDANLNLKQTQIAKSSESNRRLAGEAKADIRRAVTDNGAKFTREEDRRARQNQKSGIKSRNATLGIKESATGETIEGTLRQVIGGHLKSIGDDSNELQEYKDMLDNGVANGRFTRAEADRALRSMMRNPRYSRYKGWEDSKQHETYQKIFKKGTEIYDKGTAQVQSAQEGAGRLKKAYLGALGSGIGMASDMLAGPAWMVSMTSRTYGGEIGNAEKEGATRLEDRRYAGLQALKEVGTEGMFSAIGLSAGLVKGRGLFDSFAGRLTNRVGESGIRSALRKYGMGIAEENLEEVAGWALDPAIKNLSYGNNLWARQVRQSTRDEGDELRSAIASMDENSVRAMAAHLNSDSYLKQISDEMKANGATDDEAREMALTMQAYMNAVLTGNKEAEAAYENEMVRQLKGKNPNKATLSWSELGETLASTTLLTGVTGIGGTISTAALGNTIKQQNGISFVKNMADKVKLYDIDNSSKGQAVSDHIASGRDVAGTQVADITEKFEKIQADAYERYQTSNQTKETLMRREDLRVQPRQQNADGTYSLGEITDRAYDEYTREALDYLEQSGMDITQEDAEIIADAYGAYMTGVINPDQMAVINTDNAAARTLFSDLADINFNEYTVRDRRGIVDTARTNINTEYGLYAKAADNYVGYARLEQNNWNDTARGVAGTQLASGLGTNGNLAIQHALNTVDPRDRGKFMLTGQAARRVYEYARNTNDTWEQTKRSLTDMFKGVDETAIKFAFNAAKEDKAKAETAYYGKIVDKNSIDPDRIGMAEGTFTNESERLLKGSEVSTLSSVARELGINVVMSDSLDLNENGRYSPSERTITLNSANTMGDNLNAIFSHEVTHHLAAYAPDEYVKLSRFIMDRWFKEDSEGYNREIQRIQTLYKNAKGQELSNEEALEELIADGSRDFWTDEELITSVSAEEPSLAKTIIDAIKGFLRKLRAMLSSGEITDEATRDGLFAEIDAYEEAHRLWMNAYNAARKAQADQAIDEWQDNANRQNSPRLSAGEEKYSITTDKEDFVKGANLSKELKDWAKDMGLDKLSSQPVKGPVIVSVRDLRTAWYEKNGRADEANVINTALDKIGDSLTQLVGEYQYIDLGDALNAAVTYRTDAEGHPTSVILSCQVKNAEYEVNFDFTTICAKRLAMQKILERFIKTEGERQGTTLYDELKLDEEGLYKLRLILETAGFEVSCRGCFVEQNRYSQQNQARTIANDWNAALDEWAKDNGTEVTENFGLTTLDIDNLDYEEIEAGFERYHELMKGKKTDVATKNRMLIEASPFFRKRMNASDYASMAGQRALMAIGESKKGGTNLYGLLKRGQSDSKQSVPFTAYNGEISLLPDNMKGKSLYDYLLSIGGARAQSASDFQIEFVYDYMQMVADLSARGLPMHMYTKVIELAELFGMTGIKINLSAMCDVAEDLGGEYAGLKLVDGKYEYNISDQSIDYEKAVALQKKDGYSKNIGIIMVALSSQHMLKSLDDPDVRYIIGYHSSAMPVVVANMSNMGGATDYTKINKTNKLNEKGKVLFDAAMEEAKGNTELEKYKDALRIFDEKIQEETAKKKKLPRRGNEYGSYMSAYGGNTADFNTYDSLLETKDARKTADKYLEYCMKNDLIPIYFPFAFHENYYKCEIYDFNMYDNNTGEYAPMESVQNIYPGLNMAAGETDTTAFTERVSEMMDERNRLNESLDSQYDAVFDEAKNTLKYSITGDDYMDMDASGIDHSELTHRADAPMTAEQQRDADYMDAVNSGNMEEAQRLVDEAAKAAGYGTRVYHGTSANFTVFDPERSGQNWRGYSHYGKGLYFSDSEKAANDWGKYSKGKPHLMNAFIDLKKPFDAEAQITDPDLLAEYNRLNREINPSAAESYAKLGIPFDKTSEKGGLMIEMLIGWTRDSSYSTELLKRYGYDGVKSKKTDGTTEYVVFDPEQIKSADPVTYAEDGSVIPLSERFDPTNNDIRYSLPTQDSEGNILSDGQMEYFKNSQARDEQNRLVPVYHTTNKGGFTIFDPMRSDDHRSLFFASNWDVSQTYGNYANSRFYQFEINDLNDVEKYLDAYGPDFYVLTKDEFERAGGYEADFVDFENEGPQYRFDAIQKKWKSSNRASETRTFLFNSYIEDVENGDINPDDYVVIVGVPDYSPDNRSYSDTWILANSPNELVNELKNHFLAQQNTYSGASTVGTQHGYYQCYLNLENPLIIDAQGQSWNDISDPNAVKFWIRKLIGPDRKPNGLYGVMFDGPLGEYREGTQEELSDLYNGSISGLIDMYDISIGANSFTIDRNTGEQIYGESSGNTRYWAERAEEEGHDGVIFRNLLDIGGKSEFDGLDEYSDIYIAFSSNQVKDINNENPTENPDIRYSIPSEEEVTAYALDKAESTSDVWYTDPVLLNNTVRYSMSEKDFKNRVRSEWNERRETRGLILDETSVQNDVRNLVKTIMKNSEVNKKYDADVTEKATKAVTDIFKLFKSGKLEEAANYAWDAAEDIVQNVEYVEDDMYQKYKGVITYLADTKIAAPEALMDDEEFSAFVMENLRKFLVKNKGEDISNVYTHLNTSWPKLFPKLDHPVDMFLQIAEVMDEIQPYTEVYSSEEAAKLTEDTAAALVEIAKSGEAYKSAADIMNPVFDRETKALKQRHKEAMSKVRTRRDELIQNEKGRTARQKERADKWKQKYNDRIQRDKEKKEEKKERQTHRELYSKTLKEYKDLTHKLLHPTKDKAKNVPEQLRQPLAHLLYCFDLEKERSKELEEMYMLPTRAQLNFRELKDAMDKVIKEDPTAYELSDVQRYMADKMVDLADRVDGKTIDALDNEDLNTIADLLKGISEGIKNGQQLEIDGENYEKQQQCDKVGAGAYEHQKLYGKAKKYGSNEEPGIIALADHIVNMGELTPIYFFRQIKGIYDMYRQMRKGFDNYVRNEKDIIDKIADILAPYYKTNRKKQRIQGSEIEEWRTLESAETFDLITANQKITLTIAQKMSLYCLAKRKQAQAHMFSENGGVIASEASFGSRMHKAEEKYKGKEIEYKSVVLTPADIETITSTLTEEQKEIADSLQRLMSEDMSKLGNEASVKLTGIEMYKEKEYFPIKVQGESLPTDPENIGIREKIRNPGFSNPLQENASNPIIVDDIFTVVASHCNEMNQYASYAVPITNFMKVYNGSVMGEDGKPVKIKTLLKETYGEKALTYIENFIDDINGNSFKRHGGLDDVLDKALGQAKKAAVFANLRVALQQPTAIIRAFAVMKVKYFKGVKPSAAATQEMFEHCPIALWKSWGYYDTHFGRDIEDVMMGKNQPSKMDYLMSEAYGWFDNMTWGMIWQAVKNEVRENNPNVEEGSEEFWELCNERASFVFDSTQVVDSPFHRSNDMRSKNGLVKQLTSFQAEPTLSFNVLRQGFVDAYEALKKGDSKKARKLLGRVLMVWVAQALTVALAQSFVDALRRKGKKKKDEEEDEMLAWYQELYKYFMRNFGNNLKDDLNPINNIYFIKDIVPPILNAIKGEYVYGTQSLTTQWVDTLTNGISMCKKKWEKGEADYHTWYDCLTELMGGIGYLAGFPAKTMMRGTKNAFHWAGKILGVNVFADDGEAVDKAVDAFVDNFRGDKTESEGGGLFDSIANKLGYQKQGTEDVVSETTSESTMTEDDLPDNLTDEQKADILKAEKRRTDKAKDAEKIEKRDYDTMLYDALKASAGYEGEDHDKKIWQSVSKGYKAYIEEGNYERINMMRRVVEEAGGDLAYFDKQVNEASKSALKKSIKPASEMTEEEYYAQKSILGHLRQSGMSDEEIGEYVYKSETRTDLQVAMRINDEDAIFDELTALVGAGFTEADFEKAYKNRNRVNLKNYKDRGGKYADKLKSVGTFIWPASGVITSHFGYRDAPTAGASSNHPAIDIGVPIGTPVAAADGGVVIYAGHNSGYGNSVGIKHDNGMVTYYNHLDSWNVKVGDTVAQGQQIACSGNTGISTGPHLDFKILNADGKPVDPEKYLSK